MSASETPDAEIILASLQQSELFGEIFTRHHDVIFRYVARRVGSQDAADVTADVFGRAFTIRHRYDTTRPACLPWLYGIAVNIIGDRLRRVKRQQRTYLVVASETVVDESEDSDSRLIAEQASGRINHALARLSHKDRETLLLYALEGLTYKEISAALSIPVGTVGSRISRARSQILELLPDLAQTTGLEVPKPPSGTDYG